MDKEQAIREANQTYYDPKTGKGDKEYYPEIVDTLLGDSGESFHIANQGEAPDKVVKCNVCNGDKFNVAGGSYRTSIRCINCQYEVLIHEG